MEFTDQIIRCVDCKENFVFEAGEQRFFAERQFTPPRRCKECRAKKKAEKAVAAPTQHSPGTCSGCGAPNPNKNSGLCNVCDFGTRKGRR